MRTMKTVAVAAAAFLCLSLARADRAAAADNAVHEGHIEEAVVSDAAPRATEPEVTTAPTADAWQGTAAPSVFALAGADMSTLPSSTAMGCAPLPLGELWVCCIRVLGQIICTVG